MDVLARWAAVLAISGGALIAIIASLLVLQPAAAGGMAAWYAMFFGIAALGAAVPGMYRRTGQRTGRLGLVAASLSGLGAVLTIGMVAYFAATNQIVAVQQALPEGPIGAVAMGASLAWLTGNLGFAVAIARTRALPRLGAWLVLLGAAMPIALAPLATDASSPLAAVGAAAFLLLPLGWIVLGVASYRVVPRATARAGA